MTVETLFELALKTPRAERPALLDSACQGDSELRNRIERMLAAQEEPLGGGDVAPTATYVGESVGSVVGRYTLDRRLGEGGMGSVWVAKQSEPVKRRVALKLIKAGMDSRSVLQRFEAERQALAVMDHPNIARVFDGGLLPDGRPFFAMELVDGLPITKFCDEGSIGTRGRLELFVKVCQAVQHAHQKGIIHRDLKPANVLVTKIDGKPEPKVIDFGVAKAVGGKLNDAAETTQFGAIVGTLEYMAPEQAVYSGADIDTRADVYALGVILYELLTGLRPFDSKRLKQAALDEVIRIIREEEPAKPSTRLSSSESLPSTAAVRHSDPQRLVRSLRGDLDWISLKCLEKDRNRRYETANGLAADVMRHLADEPVLACPPSFGYRARKFIRKHRGAVFSAGLVLLALVAGIVGTTMGLLEANRQAEIARGETIAKDAALTAEAEERRKAETAKAVAQAKEAEANAVVDFFKDRVFSAGRPKGQEGGLGSDVTLRAAVAASLPVLENGFTNQPLVEARLRQALGTTFFFLGEFEKARDQDERALTLYVRHAGREHSGGLSSMHNLANCYLELNRPAEALKLHEEALEIQKRTMPREHPHALSGMQNLANAYRVLNRHQDALKLEEEVLAIRKKTLPQDDPDTLMSMNNLANTYAKLNRNDEAMKLHEQVLAARRRVLPKDHPLTASSLFNVASMYWDSSRGPDAVKLYEESLTIRKRALPKDHPHTAMTMQNLANAYAKLNRHADSLELRMALLDTQRRVLPKDDRETLLTIIALATSLVRLERGAEAIPLLDEFIAKAPTAQGMNPAAVPFAVGLRMGHFKKIGDPTGCRATAVVWEKLDLTDAASFYDAACFRSVAAKVQKKASGADAEKLAAVDADLAMQWLQKAVAAGFRNAAQIEKEADLESIRDRDAFKKLIAQLPKSAPKKDAKK